jgi:porin
MHMRAREVMRMFFTRAVTVVSITILMPGSALSDTKVRPRLSTDDVENQITLDRESNPLYESILLGPISKWRDGVGERTGFNWSLDYSAFFAGVSDSPGEDSASSGMVRFFGFWDLVDRGGKNKGSLNWKVEHRHKYTDIPPSALGFESGYAGLIGPPFNNQEWRLTNLFWKQYFAGGKWAAVAGFLDATDYVDVYLLASPWLGFTNFNFSTGSAAMDLPNEAAVGAAAGGMITDRIYVQAGFTDANSDPTEPFDNLLKENDFFKWVEIGFVPSQQALYFDNLHLTYWHVDERANGTPKGWGLNASWQKWIGDKWLPFVRGGYTEDSGSLLERSVSVGLGYQPVPKRGVVGFGLNWGRPNETSFGDVDDQFTAEIFWRYQLTKELAVTPTVQYINNPALNPEEDNIWALGLRVRLAL